MRAARTLLHIAAVAACSSSGEVERVIGRDSAGIRIVENYGPAWRQAEAWRLEDTPAVTIGDQPAEPGHELFVVSGALRLPDGRIVVANQGDMSVRVYSGAGDLETATGRRGGGPDEFTGMAAPFLISSDSIAVFDYNRDRVVIMDAGGAIARAIDVRLEGNYWILGALAPDAFLALEVGTCWPPPEESGIHWDSTFAIAYRSESAADTLGTFPSRACLGGEGRRMAVHLPSRSQAAHGGRFAFGTGESYEIREFVDGRLARIIRRAHEPVVRSDSLVTAYRDEYFAFLDRVGDPEYTPELRPTIERNLRDAYYAETLPAYSALLFDDDGNLWAQAYQHNRWLGESHWSVFDPDGVWLGDVATPAAFRVHHIANGYVTGVARDDKGVEIVRSHRLIRP